MSLPKLSRIAAMGAALAGSAFACSVMPVHKNIVEKKDAAPVTIHGVLVKSELAPRCNGTSRLLHFRVVKAYGMQAAPGDTVVVATPSSSAACGVDYPAGREVVVFASPAPCQTPAGSLHTHMASFNVEQPSKSQVDSLEGPTALDPVRKPASAAGPGLRRSGAQVTYPVPGDAAMRRDAGGRAR